jgi:hypothetical protein
MIEIFTSDDGICLKTKTGTLTLYIQPDEEGTGWEFEWRREDGGIPAGGWIGSCTKEKAIELAIETATKTKELEE